MDSRQLFHEAEQRAEATVAVLRILVACMLGLALLLAANPFADRPPLITGQIILAVGTLAAWLALGVASFYLVRRGSYQTWMAWPFATLDVAFIIGSLQLGLMNMGVPADFAASFPVIWVAPLALTFGALRYNPWLQAYVTVALVTGLAAVWWFGASGATPSVGPPPPALGFLFAPPPNVMRTVMLTLAGAVLVLAAARARRLLRRAIDETQQRANLTRYLPPQIADRLAGGGLDELRRGRRQRVAVLFCDLRGFTTRAEQLDPAELSAFVTEFRRGVTEAATSTGGIIDKFIGDAALVAFGIPDPGPNDARNALACARALLDAIAAWNAGRGEDPAAIAIGVHYGEAFCGAVGDNRRLEFTMLGDTVNVAARLEELAKTQGIPLIVSEDILRAAGQDPVGSRWIALPAQQLRGRTAPLNVFGAGRSME